MSNLQEGKDYFCQFSDGAWDRNDWLEVRSPRWQEMSHWEQHDDYIANYLPDDLRPKDIQMGRDRTGESYISMLLKVPVTGSAKTTVHTVFDSRMAPLLVFSKELTPIHHEHLEVVLYDCGINLWHHFWVDGKPSWKLLGFVDLNLSIGEKYCLTAEMVFKKKGTFLIMGCNEHTFGVRLPDEWPAIYYVGFTGCEGKNRFYDFSLQLGENHSEVMEERVSD